MAIRGRGEEMRKFRITVSGCDDSTTIEKKLTDAELRLIEVVAHEITEASEYGCMPTMEVEEVETK